MVYKKPTGGRDDRPNKSSARSNSGEGAPKRPSSSSSRSPYGTRGADSGNNYSADRRTSSNSKPYKNSDSDNERPKRGTSSGSAFGGGDKKAFVPKGRPYSGRPDGERPQRRFDNEERSGLGPASFKKPFSKDKPFAKDKPFGNRPDGDRKPFNRDAKNTTGKKDFANTTSGYKKFDRERPQGDAPARTMRGRKNAAAPKAKDDGLIRLNRYIANAGICSRRKADELITAGVVSVNGVVISELGHKVDPYKDEVRYNNEPLKREKMVYVLLNKPKDYITTTDDPQERRTVMHLVEKASRERIYPVGRLDRNTTGLLLMTNDGDLADKLSHPRNNITKLYNVELSKSLTQGDLNKIQFGLELEDGFIKPDSVSYVTGGTKREIGIQIHSGKNRIVRRIFESLGYEVVKLDRSIYANLTKKDLPRGRWRYLDEKEVVQLKHLIQLV
ncbi:pseudouridine synthase [Mucilaginibacter pedocola]|uniref:Pseudouridine synthase n=1 Tax=Mucilaginibacter pedocola TaxID=1792845 RepID=A0A1S9PCF6_9SPHI|nr:pseudouridine synthase [Mucilaginibacter pedocola]OOQ58674.1 pseudouridylate synthase [Mucilaginibacter pedocola]